MGDSYSLVGIDSGFGRNPGIEHVDTHLRLAAALFGLDGGRMPR